MVLDSISTVKTCDQRTITLYPRIFGSSAYSGALRSREADHARFEKAMQAVIEHRDTEYDRFAASFRHKVGGAG
jgi:hypothetical protein